MGSNFYNDCRNALFSGAMSNVDASAAVKTWRVGAEVVHRVPRSTSGSSVVFGVQGSVA